MATGGTSIVLLQQALKRRPWISRGVIGVGGIITTAGLVEYHAEWKEQQSLLSSANNDTSCHLPRVYNRDIVSKYWMQRPISITYRLGQVLYELGPLGMGYVKDFVLAPKFQNWQRRRRRQQPPQQQIDNDDNDNNKNSKTQLQLQQDYAKQLRHALTNLGPAWVKGGQQLSIRPDLVPPVVLKELQKLCDSVEPIPDDVALEMIRTELELESLDEVFENVHLVAAASIGQVYKARIKKTTTTTTTTTTQNHDKQRQQQQLPETVAIKVQRPGMRRCFSMDLFLLQKWGDFMDAFTSTFTQQTPYHKALFDHFSKGSYSELDYENEAANQLQFQSELAKRDCRVVIPNVYTEYTTERVLTTQWMDGVKLADSPKEQIRELIPVGVELFLTQLLDIGAFHADPHPGNLLVTPDGKTLCLLDFGLCAVVDARSRMAMTNAIVHLLSRDFDALVGQDAKALGFLPDDFDTTELKPILTKVLTGGLLESGSNLKNRKRKLMEISNELNEIFFRYPFQVPPFFALVTRGLGLLEGIALTGDPDFDIFRASAPYATKRAVTMLGQRMRTRRAVGA